MTPRADSPTVVELPAQAGFEAAGLAADFDTAAPLDAVPAARLAVD